MKQIGLNVALMLTSAALAACAASPPGVDEQFGTAVRAITAQQIANVTPVPPGKSLVGLDGKAAKDLMDQYHAASQSKQPAPQSVFSIAVDSPK